MHLYYQSLLSRLPMHLYYKSLLPCLHNASLSTKSPTTSSQCIFITKVSYYVFTMYFILPKFTTTSSDSIFATEVYYHVFTMHLYHQSLLPRILTASLLSESTTMSSHCICITRVSYHHLYYQSLLTKSLLPNYVSDSIVLPKSFYNVFSMYRCY